MIKGFQSFLANAKSPYHVNEYIKNNIFNNELNKLEDNDNILGKTFIETRNNTSIILISIPNEIDIKDITFNIACAHNDSPTFKLKQNFLLRKGGYNLLNTEIYGGPILNTFMDRPFDVCGRILYRDNNKIKHINVSLDKAVCIIPNCSIHYYPDLNKGVKLNPQEELVPIISKENTDLLQQYCDKYKLNKEDILSYDLFLSLIDRGMTLGENDEFFTGPQLDDLSSVYPMLMSFKDQIKKNKKQINVCAIFNNEEIGSNTKEGASSTFLKEILSEVYYKLTNNYNGYF